MANPFGIEQVDIAGLIGMHQGLKRQRIADLMAARDYEIKVKEEERRAKKDETLARIFMKGGGQASGGTGTTQQAPAVPAPSPAPTGELPPVAAPSATITAEQAAATRAALGDERYQQWKAANGISEEGELPPVAAPTEAAHPLDTHAVGDQLPPRTDGLTINMDALRDLYALDPKGAAEIQKLVYDSDKQQLEQATARGEAMAVAAAALRGLPEGQRQAELQRNWASYLIDRGLDPAQIQQADLSDAGLQRYYFQGRTIENIISSAESERNSRRQQANTDADNARADASLDLRREALNLAKTREGRIAAGGSGGAGDAAGMSTDALLGMALGN